MRKTMMGVFCAVASALSLGVFASSGSAYVRSTQQAAVRTGYKANKNSQFYCDFQWTERQRKQWLFGNNDNGGTFTAAVYINGSSPHISAWAMQDGTGNWTATGVWADLERHLAVLDGPGNLHQIKTLSPQGESIVQQATISTTRTKTATSDTAVFACIKKDGTWDTGCWGTPIVYSFEIRESGTLKHFFAPYQSGSTVGLKDIVTGNVKTNAGSGGELIYGDGVGKADDYKYEGGQLYCKVYALANCASWGSVTVNSSATPAAGTWVAQRTGNITLKATPAAGYTFLGWAGDAEAIQNSAWRNPEVTVSPLSAKRLVAAFVPKADCQIKGTLVTLVRDADWRGAALAVPYGMSMNLNGHKLQVSDTEGPGEVVNVAVDGPERAAAIAAPSITSSASFWLDAADADTITVDNTRNVTRWTSRAGSLVANGDSLKPRYEPYTFGRPTVDFGDFSNKRDMTYTRLSSLRTVFWVMQITDDPNNFLLGDSSNYNFHRGSGTHATIGNSSHAKYSQTWLGGQKVGWSTTSLPAEGFHVIAATMSQNCNSDRLTTDRNCFDNSATGRSGGRQLSELICFNSVLSDAQVDEVNEYLRKKWECFRAPGAAELHIDVPANTTVENRTLVIAGDVKVVKDGAGTLAFSKVRQLYTGGTEVAAGTLAANGPGISTFNNVGTRRLFGSYEGEISVKGGATFDLNGRSDFYNYMFHLQGGTLANYGRDISESIATISRLYVDADSAIAGNNFGLIMSSYGNTGLYLQKHTLDINLATPAKQFVIANAYIGPGTLHLVQGRLRNYKASNYARETDVVGEANSSISSDNSGFFYPRSLTTKGDVLGGNWIYANSYVHEVAAGATKENSGALSKDGVSSTSVTLTKRGPGRLNVGNTNNNYTGPVTIEEGSIKLTQAKALGSGVVTIKDGAWIDLDLQNNAVSGNQNSSFSIIGHGDGNGVVQNNSTGTKALNLHTPFNNMTLAGDASIGGSIEIFPVIASGYAAFTWNLGAYTFEKRGPSILMPCNCTVNGTGLFDIKQGGLAAQGSVTVNTPIAFRAGTKLDLAVRDAAKVTKFVFNNTATFADAAPCQGSGAIVEFNGTVEGLSTFGDGALVLGGASRLVLPAGAAKFAAAGTVVANGNATFDVSALFANGEPVGDAVTVFESADGISGFLNVTGVGDGWNVQYGEKVVQLVKGTPVVATLPCQTSETVSVNSSTVFSIPEAVGAALQPGFYPLAKWNTPATGYGAPTVKVEGCEYEWEVINGLNQITLWVKSAADLARKPVKIWAVGDQWVATATWRVPLAQALTLDGWNVKMTGFRTTNNTDPSGAAAKPEWRGHTGIASASFKSSANYAGLLEGIDAFAAGADEPDITIINAGVFEYWSNNYTGTVAAVHWEQLVNRVLNALPNTVVIGITCPVQTYNQTADATKAGRDYNREQMNAGIRAAFAKTEAQGGFPAGRVVLLDFAADATLTPATMYTNNWEFKAPGYKWAADKYKSAIEAIATRAGLNGAPKLVRALNDPMGEELTLAATFNKPIAAVPATAALATAGDATVPTLSAPALSEDGRTVTYTLSAALTPGAEYTLTLGAVEDADGAATAAPALTFTARASGALANVPAAYTTGFQKLAVLEPNPGPNTYAQSRAAVPWTWRADALPQSGITKAGYYIETVRADDGKMTRMWIDMDAPGAGFDDISFPVTLAQRKQQTVSKLHVWTDFGGVTPVAADDDSVTGAIGFNYINYSGGRSNYSGAPASLWSSAYDWDDTLGAAAATGHGCFHFYRILPSGSEVSAEVLFAYNCWGNGQTAINGLGFGTLADNKQFTGSNQTFNWTFMSCSAGDDRCKLNAAAYKSIRIEFWAKFDGTPARDDEADGTWTGATDNDFATAGNWSKDNTALTSLADKLLLFPASATPVDFTYIGKDPVTVAAGLRVAGTCGFTAQGALILDKIEIDNGGKLVLDPAKVSIRLTTAPAFLNGAKIALASKYAAYTKGRFLVMSWNKGQLTGDLTTLFDASSAAGVSPQFTVETMPSGAGRLWLDLDSTASYPTLRVMPVGDSITHGNASSYGNWRIPLMKKLLAEGYLPVSTGMHADQSSDETGCEIPEEWKWHSGVSGRKLMTVSGKSAGVIDAIETELDQAGDVDVLLLKIGTNDINGNGTDADTLFDAWCDLRDKILAQSQCKLICGAVVNIADATKNAQVVAFNAKVRAACEADQTGRVFFADLYTACPRYDGDNNFIDGSFSSATDLHPDWPGEDKMAEEYCRVIKLALAGGLPVHPAPTSTTLGCAANVPAAYRAGFKLARSIDAKYTGGMASGVVPYDDYSANEGATTDLARVGYYVELKRKNTAITDYHDMVRWLWVDVSAFAGRDIENCGVPLTVINQCPVYALHIASNMPGIANVLPTDDSVTGFIEFWYCNYDGNASGVPGAPANLNNTDWNDNCTKANNYSCMQVHRVLPTGSRNPAQVLFAFNHWNPANCENQIGLGTFAFHQKNSLDWTWVTGGEHASAAVFDSSAYEVARVEIWTRSVSEEAELRGLANGLVWRPQDATATVSCAVPAWRNAADSSDTTVYPFLSGLKMNFDGADAVSGFNTIPVPTAVAAEEVAFTGSKSYTVNGGASISAGKVTVGLANSATLTLDNAKLETDELVINSGKVVLGENVLLSPFGANADGVVRIGPNGQLDLNNKSTSSNVNNRNSVLADKIVYIEGDGPDGRGAIINYGGVDTWHQMFGRVVLVGDASIGGNARMDFRAVFGSRKYTGRCQLQGAGYVLTDRFVNAPNYGLHFNNTDIALQKLVVVDNAVLGFEGTINLDIPDGIELNSGARIDLYQTTVTGNARIVVKSGATATIRCTSANGIVDVPIVVESGATLKLSGGNALRLDRGIENHGQIVNEGGSWWVNPTAGWESANLGNFTFTSGNIWFGDYTTSTLPGFSNVSVTGASTGEIWLRTGKDVEIDGSKWNIQAPGATMWAASDLNGAESIQQVPSITIHDADWAVGAFQMGSSSYNGHVVLDNAKITTGTINMDTSTNYKSGYLELNNGSKLTVTAANHGAESCAIKIASTTSTYDFENVIEVNDGSELAVPNGYTFIGWSGRYARIDVNPGGTATFYGVNGRRRYNGIGGSNKRGHDSCFRLQGGTLNIGPAAFMHGYMAYASKAQSNEVCNDHYAEVGPVFRLNDGTINVTASTEDTNSQRSPGVNVAFGDTAATAGDVVIDVKNYNFDLRTGLKGHSDVTLRGNGGTFRSSQWTQGIPAGRWTVESGVDAQLDGAAGFQGGLELAPNATARVNAKSESLVMSYSGSRSLASFMAGDYCNFYATDLHYIHQTKHSTGPSYHTYGYAGEFYVSAEQAGTWYFYGSWDDGVNLIVDGTNLSSGNDVNGNIALAEGWHTFLCGATDGYGAQGPDWGSNNMGIGYRIGSSGGTTQSNYTHFDTATLKMRPPRKTNFWHYKVGAAWTVYDIEDYVTRRPEDYGFFSVTNSVKQWNNTTSTDNTFTTNYLALARNRVSGRFYVDASKAGVWQAKLGYDDFSAFYIDGQLVVAAPTHTYQARGSMVVTEGVHEFELYFGDTTGGYGLNSNAAIYPYATLAVSINGGGYMPFDEDHFQLGAEPTPGLAGDSRIGAGATLTNVGAAAYPITGTLWGGGTISGPFAFKGGWLGLESDGGSTYAVPQFDNVGNDVFTELAGVKASFAAKPGRSVYRLGGANGLNGTSVRELGLDVEIADMDMDLAEKLIDKMYLRVQNGNLELVNPSAAPSFIFIR